MLSDKAQEAAALIGHFYLTKNNGDYQATEREIEQLRISKVEVVDDSVVITTARPGLLIGRRGMNIDALTQHLQTKVRIIEDEDRLNSYLIPRQPEDY